MIRNNKKSFSLLLNTYEKIKNNDQPSKDEIKEIFKIYHDFQNNYSELKTYAEYEEDKKLKNYEKYFEINNYLFKLKQEQKLKSISLDYEIDSDDYLSEDFKEIIIDSKYIENLLNVSTLKNTLNNFNDLKSFSIIDKIKSFQNQSIEEIKKLKENGQINQLESKILVFLLEIWFNKYIKAVDDYKIGKEYSELKDVNEDKIIQDVWNDFKEKIINCFLEEFPEVKKSDLLTDLNKKIKTKDLNMNNNKFVEELIKTNSYEYTENLKVNYLEITNHLLKIKDVLENTTNKTLV